MSTWIDLSHPIADGDVPAKMPFLPNPTFRPIDDAALRATEVTIATHVATHLEAPCHLLDDGRSIDSYPAAHWIGTGIVAAVEAKSCEAIDRADLELSRTPEAGEALLIHTGWEDLVGEERYLEPPYLSRSLASWIADQDVAWVGVDSPSPEMPSSMREADPFTYPVHRTLFEAEIPIAEHLTNTGDVVGSIVEVIALPIRYVGADGAHARIVARPVRETGSH